MNSSLLKIIEILSAGAAGLVKVQGLADGVGAVHVNQFRLYCIDRKGRKPEEIVSKIRSSFVELFVDNPVAHAYIAGDQGTVPKSKLSPEARVVEFMSLGVLSKIAQAVVGDRTDPVLILPSVSGHCFTARTQRIVGFGPNHHHFLSGVRSWTVVPYTERSDEPAPFAGLENAMIIETAAIERYSLRRHLILAPILQLRQKIEDTWCCFLQDCIGGIPGLEPLPISTDLPKPADSFGRWRLRSQKASDAPRMRWKRPNVEIALRQSAHLSDERIWSMRYAERLWILHPDLACVFDEDADRSSQSPTSNK